MQRFVFLGQWTITFLCHLWQTTFGGGCWALTCFVTWRGDGAVGYVPRYHLAKPLLRVAILNWLLQWHKSAVSSEPVPVLHASRWLQMRSLFWQFHRRAPNSLNKPTHILDHLKQLWDEKWTHTKTFGNCETTLKIPLWLLSSVDSLGKAGGDWLHWPPHLSSALGVGTAWVVVVIWLGRRQFFSNLSDCKFHPEASWQYGWWYSCDTPCFLPIPRYTYNKSCDLRVTLEIHRIRSSSETILSLVLGICICLSELFVKADLSVLPLRVCSLYSRCIAPEGNIWVLSTDPAEYWVLSFWCSFPEEEISQFLCPSELQLILVTFSLFFLIP